VNRFQLLFCSILSGALLWLGWPPLHTSLVLLSAFVPILFAEKILTERKSSVWKIFGHAYLCFLIWNIATTWWVGNTTAPLSGVFANTANALLMCFPFLFFHQTKKRFGKTRGYIALVSGWLTLEIIHLHWQLAWPWLNIGNGLASTPSLAQWYEFTGTTGGTVWILLSNILLFEFINYLILNKTTNRPLLFLKGFFAFTVISLPILISLWIYYSLQILETSTKQIVIVQPNIDPYNEKFDPATMQQQLNTLLKLTTSAADSSTDYIVWPETALSSGIWENKITADPEIREIKSFLQKYPKANLITGMMSFLQYDSHATITARPFDDGTCCYDVFNGALQLDNFNHYQIYHKSIPVVGVERMPYPQLFNFLAPLMINMGGTSGSLGTQDSPSVFHAVDGTKISPLICYESVFGWYCAECVRQGAEALFVITNDGWWGNSDGYKQHVDYTSLRAIELRRCIVQAANTGTSCLIDERGNILHRSEWWKPETIDSEIRLHSAMTFYARYGDLFGDAGAIVTILIILINIFNKLKKMFLRIRTIALRRRSFKQ
jgi:apolipoprotein N-acyltransferase